jgi:N-acetylglucosamine-6-phosphate deacetylase
MGNEAILEESGRLYNPESGYLAGSSATMLDCMNYLLSLNILTVNELIELGYYNPLELIGIDPTILKQIVPTRVKKEDKFVLTDEKPIV